MTCAIHCSENKGLLTEKACFLSKESLLKQQASGPCCAYGLVLCLLLQRKLDTTSQSWLALPRVSQAIVAYVIRVPHSCQLGTCCQPCLTVTDLSLLLAPHRATSDFCVSTQKGVLVDLLCSEGSPVAHRVPLPIKVKSRTYCWSDSYKLLVPTILMDPAVIVK